MSKRLRLLLEGYGRIGSSLQSGQVEAGSELATAK